VSIKQKLLNTLSAHPKLAALAIGLALTLSIGTAIGTFDYILQQHLISKITKAAAVEYTSLFFYLPINTISTTFFNTKQIQQNHY
jgi:hypothetical protein